MKKVPPRVVSGVVGVLLVGAVSWTVWSHLALTAEASRSMCPPGVPAAKCNPPPIPGNEINPHALPSPSVSPGPWPNPPVISAGRNFFTATQTNQLLAQYGSIDIVGYGSYWLIVGNGQSTTSSATPPAMARGGPLVAIESCMTTTCLDPNSPHAPSDFTTVPLPDPNVSISLLSTYGGRLAYLWDGSAGDVILDLQSLKWFHGRLSTFMANPSEFAPLPAASPMQGIVLP
jgi:hypothetical protein